MSENPIKSWERPWTTEEMIENSSNWSLAGDSGLLKYLEEFSDRFDKIREELEKRVKALQLVKSDQLKEIERLNTEKQEMQKMAEKIAEKYEDIKDKQEELTKSLMSENPIKSWERPWTTEEMIENSSNWSLAGDSGLLKYLEEFSDKILTKTKETNDKLENLGETITKTQINLSNVHNEFMGLHNTQFIESRVYEDDETLPSNPQIEKDPPKVTDAERIEEMKQAILNGLDAVDKYYEKFEIPASDSEDETDEPSVIFQPIDQYADRPLPYVIGSNEWHKYWHVGLLESSSDSEIENQDEEFSESDTEQDIKKLPPQIPIGLSDTESEAELKINQTIPQPKLVDNDNIFGSSSESETGSARINNIPANNAFAAELAAKLGKVEGIVEPEINKKPIQKPTYNTGLFLDEPPPLDEDDNKPIKTGMFSGGDGLFDDDDDDLDESDSFWTPKIKPKPNLFTNTEVIKNVEAKKPITGGLFDDEDDNLFSSKPTTQPLKQTLFDEKPPEIEEVSNKKKIVGSVSLFGNNSSLLDQVKKRVEQKEVSPEKKLFDDATKPEIIKNSEPETIKSPIGKSPEISTESKKSPEIVSQSSETKVSKSSYVEKKLPSLFDDDAPLFNDDIFGTNTKFTSGLFDEVPSKSGPKKPSLFDDEPPDEPSKRLFVDESKSSKSSLFSDGSETPKGNDKQLSKKSSKSSLFSDEQPDFSVGKIKKLSLFDDEPPDDDIFGNKSSIFVDGNNTNTGGSRLFMDTSPESNKLFSDTTTSKKEINKSKSLFDDEEPDDANTNIFSDKTITKSNKLFNDEKLEEVSKKNKSLFMDEKPKEISIKNELLFDDEKPTEISNKTPLFDDVSVENKNQTLFDDKSLENKNRTLFDDESLENKNRSLFDDESLENKNRSLLADESLKRNRDKLSLFSDEPKLKIDEKKSTSLFSDDDSPDFLTNITSKKPSRLNLDESRKKKESTLLFSDSDESPELFKNSKPSVENDYGYDKKIINRKEDDKKSVGTNDENTDREDQNVISLKDDTITNEEDKKYIKSGEEEISSKEDDKEIISSMEDDKTFRSAMEENKTFLSAMEENKTSLGAMEENKTSLSAMEENKTFRSAMEENKPFRSAMEENKTFRSAMEENKTSLGAMEENKTSLSAMEENKTFRSAMEENKTFRSEMEENKTSLGAMEENKTSLGAMEENKTSLSAMEENKTSQSAMEENKTSLSAMEENKISSKEDRKIEIEKSPDLFIGIDDNTKLDTPNIEPQDESKQPTILDSETIDSGIDTSSNNRSMLSNEPPKINEPSDTKTSLTFSPLYSNEPPPLDNISQKSDDNLFSTKIEGSSRKSSETSDIENDLFGGTNKYPPGKLSEGRQDLFSDTLKPTYPGGDGLFDWEQPPPLNTGSDRSETKKSTSSLFSDEEDLFESSTSDVHKKSLWDPEPPPLESKPKRKENLFTVNTSEDNRQSKLLFSDDDDLFSKPKNEKKQGNQTKPNLFSDDETFVKAKETDLLKAPKAERKISDVTDPLSTIDNSPLFTNKTVDQSNIFSDDDSDMLFSSDVKTNVIKTSRITSLKDDKLPEKPKVKSEKPKKKTDFFTEDELFKKKKSGKEIRNVESDPKIHKDSDALKPKRDDPLFTDDVDNVMKIEKKTEKFFDDQPEPSMFDNKKSVISSSLFSDDEDIFNKPSVKEKPRIEPKSPKTNTSLFSEDSDDDLFSNKQPVVETKIQSSPIKKSGSSGKLKHSLNINVAALLPGAVPKKKVQNPDEAVQSSPEKIVSPTEVKSSSELFPDSPMENVDILTSAAKQRVRGAPKRRPSTRKGRQEAIRKSGMEFNIDIPETEPKQPDNYVSPTESEKNIQNAANNNLIQDNKNISEKSDVSTIKSEKTDSIFSDDDSDIFTVKKTQPVIQKSLFDDDGDDEDDDIFNSIITKPSTTTGTGSTTGSSKTKQASRIKKLTPHSDDTIINDPLDVINK